MRGARLQSSDLERTGKFLTTMLTKDDVKDLEQPDVPEPPKQQQSLVNGSAIPFRADPKARFSDPPAPPPQQPLPEKPDIPILKRAITDRPKSHPATSPIRDNVNQILQLQEDLKNTKKELEGRDARLRELEESLQRERTARETAEELARRLEDAAATLPAEALAELPADTPDNASAPAQMNGSAKTSDLDDILDEAFKPPQERDAPEEPHGAPSSFGQSLADQAESIQTAASEYQSRVDEMASEIKGLKEQLEMWRQRCETAESERDADRKTLAEMVTQIRDEQEKQAAAAAAAAASKRDKSRGRSKSRNQSASRQAEKTGVQEATQDALPSKEGAAPDGPVLEDGSPKSTLSRASTITPQAPLGASVPQDQRLAAGLPYASMLGVVLIGVGLMAYINGWQPAPRR